MKERNQRIRRPYSRIAWSDHARNAGQGGEAVNPTSDLKGYMKITNLFGMPQSIVNAIENDVYDGPKTETSDELSVTTLISPVRIYFLKKRHWNELTEDASKRLWSLMGQAVHSVLERAESKNNIVEERIKKEFDGTVISGKMDVMDETEIADYKFTSVWQYVHAPKGKPEHIAQVNVLRWLVYGIFPKVSKLTINLLLKDWSAGKAKSTPDFPRIPFVSISAPLWPLGVTEAYIQGRVEAFRAAAGLPDDQLPECTTEETWERPTVYAVVKDGGKRAIPGGLCSSMEIAKTMTGPKMHIEIRIGGRGRCAEYCIVSHLCNQYQTWLKSNEGAKTEEVE